MKFGGSNQKNSWHAYEHLKPGNIVNPDADFTDAINSIQGQINNIVSLDSRDVVFKVSPPFKLGIEKDSEFIYPFDGTVDSITVGIHTESTFHSNALITIQYLRNGTWSLLRSLPIQINQLKYEINDIGFKINKDERLRINFIDGQIHDWEGLNIIMSIRKN